jgi:hypothetical protein
MRTSGATGNWYLPNDRANAGVAWLDTERIAYAGCCGNLLRRVTTGHARSFETRFCSITIRRVRGYCKGCHKWRFPADAALGLADTAG